MLINYKIQFLFFIFSIPLSLKAKNNIDEINVLQKSELSDIDSQLIRVLRKGSVPETFINSALNQIQCARLSPLVLRLKKGVEYARTSGKVMVTNESAFKFKVEILPNPIVLTEKHIIAFAGIARVLNDEKGEFTQNLTYIIEKIFNYLLSIKNQGKVPDGFRRSGKYIWQNIERGMIPHLIQNEIDFNFPTAIPIGISGNDQFIGEYIIQGYPIDDVTKADAPLHGRFPHRIQWFAICRSLSRLFDQLTMTCLELYKLSGEIANIESFVSGDNRQNSIQFGTLWEQLFD